jgi:hypothetical protein
MDWKQFRRKWSWINRGNTPVITWWYSEKARRFFVRVTGVPAEIRTEGLSNIKSRALLLYPFLRYLPFCIASVPHRVLKYVIKY